MEKEQQGNSPVLVKEKTVFLVATLANIVAWIILVIYTLNFGSNLYSMFSGGQFTSAMLPTTFPDWISFLTSIFYTLVIGLVYFATLQGISQGLNLGLDIYYSMQPAGDAKETE